jgi:hypothetical protein
MIACALIEPWRMTRRAALPCACQRRGGRMHEQEKQEPLSRKIALRLPDLDHTKAAVLNGLSSPHSRRNYKFAMEHSSPGIALNRALL